MLVRRVFVLPTLDSKSLEIVFLGLFFEARVARSIPCCLFTGVGCSKCPQSSRIAGKTWGVWPIIRPDYYSTAAHCVPWPNGGRTNNEPNGFRACIVQPSLRGNSSCCGCFCFGLCCWFLLIGQHVLPDRHVQPTRPWCTR